MTVKQVAGQPGVSRSTLYKNAGRSGVPGRTDPASQRRPSLAAGGRRCMGRYPQMRRRPLAAEPIGGTTDAARDASESGGTRARCASARRRPRRPPPARPVSGERQRTAPHASTAAGDGRSTSGEMRATLKPTLGRTCRRANRASRHEQTGTSRQERIAVAKLSELAAEARAGWNATTLEQLIVKGPHPLLPRHRRRGAQSAGRGRAAADRQRIEARRGACSTRRRPSCGTTRSSNRDNLGERGGERHVLGRSRERGSSSCSTG